MNKLPKIGETVGGWTRVGPLRVDVGYGAQLPPMYGLSYTRLDCRKGVCYPLVLNWVVWIFRELWLVLISTPKGIEYKSYMLGLRGGEKTFQSTEYMKLVEFTKEQYRKMSTKGE